jgi:hypothetical protein
MVKTLKTKEDTVTLLDAHLVLKQKQAAAFQSVHPTYILDGLL